MKYADIPIDKLITNEDNPRGINIQIDDPKLSYLKDSIAQFGILVPIVVSRQPDGKFLLVDGERRYWAAKSLRLKTLPAFIIKKNGGFTNEDILFRMFQIHHNREQWGPVQQCHALENLFQRIVKKPGIKSIKDNRAQIKAIAEELVKETGIEERTAINRVYFLRWPLQLKQKLYNNPQEEGYWYICEIEEKIVIPAILNYPEYFVKVPANEVRIDLFEKLEHHSAEKSTDVRRVAPFFRTNLTKEADRKTVIKVLSDLHKNKDMTYSEAQDELLKCFPDFHKHDPISPRKLHSMISALEMAIENFDFAALDQARRRAKASPKELISAIKSLLSSFEEFLKNLEAPSI
jgi:ParB/RepB/Spo0J family partition protein